MDTCTVDVITEFLGIAFHNILYYISVYHKSIFESRKKYSLVVYRSIHPEVNEYIDLCLKSVKESLLSGQLHAVEFAITNAFYEPVVKFVFDFDKNEHFDRTTDAYLVQAEQNLRAFCLNLSVMSHKLQDLPEDRSFSVYLHTTESGAVAMATNPGLECFPLVEVEDKWQGSNKIIPLRRFSIRNFNLDTYVEL